MGNDEAKWLTEQVSIDGDVIEVDEHTWAIHGVIPVDGEVLLAEYGTPEEAQAALTRLTGTGGPGRE